MAWDRGGAQLGEVANDPRQQFAPGHGWRAFPGSDAAGEIGAGDQPAPQHHVGAAAHRADAPPVLRQPHVPVGDQRDGDGLADKGQPLPACRGAKALGAGAGMDGEFRCAAGFHGAGAVQRQGGVVHPEAHLGADRNFRRQRAAHRRNDGVQPLRLAQQDRAGAVAVDGGRGAAKIQVYARRTQCCCNGGVLGETPRIVAQQLHPHRRAVGGASAVVEFRHGAPVFVGRNQMVGNPHELGDAQVDAANARQQVAHRGVGEAFHGGEDQAHSRGGLGGASILAPTCSCYRN